MVFEASDGYSQPILGKYESYSNNKIGSLKYFKKFNKLEVWMNKLFIDSAGAFGYIETYIRILKDAKLQGYKSILILEDDVILTRDFVSKLEFFYSNLPDSWKFIGLGASQYNWDSVDTEKAKNQGFYTPTQIDTCGSFAIAIRDTIYDELIELQSYFEAPFDHIPLGEIYKKYPSDCFVSFPYMVMPDVRSSSIRGSRNQLTHAKKMKWDPSLFDYPTVRPIINLVITSKEQTKYLNAFSDENSFPFELHLFIPSKDGFRPYHDSAQSIEVGINKSTKQLLNSGYCVSVNNKAPITEDALFSVYNSLVNKCQLPKYYEVLTSTFHDIDPDRVSVIIPTFRRSDMLADVLLSVIEQDYENKEIIIVDDNPKGSEEQLKTEAVVNKLIQEHLDTLLLYISHERNRRGAGARNTGIQHSSGNYICFLDDDDLYLPGRLSLSINKLKKTPRYIGAVYCGFIGGNSEARTNERYQEGTLSLELLLLNYLAHFLNTNTATYKREAVVRINGFDETFVRHQDLEFNLRFFEHYEMCVVTERLISIRPRPTETNNQQYGIDLFKTKQKFLKKFEYIINRYDSATKKVIYTKHWQEVVKYVDDFNPFEQELVSDLGNGQLQCYMFLQSKRNNEIVSKPVNNTHKKTLKDKDEKVVKIKDEKPINVESVNSLSKADVQRDSEILLEPDKEYENVETLIETNNDSVVNPQNKVLHNWQKQGASTFGIVFNRFILPPQRLKLRNNPVAFFTDSKNSFTRTIGKLLKII